MHGLYSWGLWCMCSFFFSLSLTLSLCVHTGQDVIYRKLTHFVRWTSDRSTSAAIGHGSKNALKCMSVCPPLQKFCLFRRFLWVVFLLSFILCVWGVDNYRFRYGLKNSFKVKISWVIKVWLFVYGRMLIEILYLMWKVFCLD